MKHVLRRAGFYLVAFWASITINFLIPRLAPGDPAGAIMGRFQGKMNPAAIHALDEGLEALRMYFSERGQPQMFEQSSEVEMLKGMRDALVPKLPVSQKAELRQRLARALEQENYELAAILRDELKQLKD